MFAAFKRFETLSDIFEIIFNLSGMSMDIYSKVFWA